MILGKSHQFYLNIYVPSIDINVSFQYKLLFSDTITEEIFVYKRPLIYMNMPCIVRYSGMWPLLSCVGTLVSQNTRLAECVIFRMEELIFFTITVHLRPMSK